MTQDINELGDIARAAMDKVWGPDHSYGPAEVNTILAMLGGIFAASNRRGRLFIVASMQELLAALISRAIEPEEPAS